MKKNLTRILGVALPLAMVLALAVTLIPASAPETTEAAVGQARFSLIPLPKYGSAGRYVLTPATNVGAIAVTPVGDTVFAAANISASASIIDLLKSTDGGYTWTLQSAFKTTAAANSDTTNITAIGVSPEYATDTTMFVATETDVYQTVDGGAAFTAMTRPSGWAGTETISDMDIALDEGGRLSIIIGSEDSGGAGDVYAYVPATTGMSWKAQAVGRDVQAAAFSPNFADDECIIAVTCNGTDTLIKLSFGSTKDGGGWGDSVGDGTFLNADAEDIATTTRARIAFPDDYDVDSTLSNIAFVGLRAGTDDHATAEYGDVYKVTLTPTKSSTEDLNVRGLVSTVRTATNIWSIDVSGDAEAATILVGTNKWTTGAAVGTYYWTTYYSTDSGVNWSSAREKSPTGASLGAAASPAAGAMTEVVMAPGFATDGVAYAGTRGGETSAFSRTADGGKSFNQISLIDYSTYYSVSDFDPNVMFGTSNPTAYMVTRIGTTRGTLWKTTDGGGKWERIWSYANPTVTDKLDKHYSVSGAEFAYDQTNGKFWRSSDDGATFPRVVNAKTGSLVVVSVIDENTIWTCNAAGAIWSTTKLGRPWVKPDESDVAGQYPTMYWRNGDKIIVSTYSGKVFISTDAGVTYTDTVGVSDLAAYSAAVFANDYADTGYIYSLVGYAGGGIWRIELNEDDPDSTEWKQIDASQANIDAGSATVKTYFGFQLSGPTLYYWDYATVNTTGNVGGFWRCVNPAADIDGIYPPLFEKTQTGLTTNMVMGFAGYGIMPNTIFMADSSVAGTSNCHNQVYAFGDVLSSPVTLVLPDDEATDQGIQLDLTLITQTVVLGWESMPLATEYKVQVSLDDGFASKTDYTGVTGTQQRASNLIPGLTYYWRVRAEEPLMSPWSETRSFVVAAFEPTVAPVVFDIVSPELGATDVSTLPTFVWTEVEGATSYELVVAEDPTFAIIDWSSTATSTFFKAEEALAYDTAYAWKVTAVPDGPSATGVFTTEAEAAEAAVTEPTEPAEIQIVEVPGAAPIPSYLLWMIIGIGAVLFIALIVLIVRTRRVA